MSFCLYNVKNMEINNCNIREHYLKLGEEFSKYYYTIYDDNFDQLGNIFSSNPCITFMDDKMSSFDEFKNKVRLNNIHKFCHHSLSGNTQPIDQDKLLLTITGKLSVNNDIHIYNFMETIVLQRMNNNSFVIINTIFQLT